MEAMSTESSRPSGESPRSAVRPSPETAPEAGAEAGAEAAADPAAPGFAEPSVVPVLPVLAHLPGSTRLPTSRPPGVVVGVDGSDGSLWALDRAFAEATAHRLPLYVVAVVNPAPGGYTPGMADLVRDSVERLLQGMTEVARRAVENVAARHPDAPEPELHVLLGDPVEILLAASGRHQMLVVGTRGNGGFSRLLLGSVASAVAHHAGCAVLLAPAGPWNTSQAAAVG
jgi:nucleotide-binding universal stress UspA family protein